MKFIFIIVFVVLCFVISHRQDVSGFTISSLQTTTVVHTRKSSNHNRNIILCLSEKFPSASSSLPSKRRQVGLAPDSFLQEYFQSDIDNVNLPPSMSIIRRSIGRLASGSDIRGEFVPHPTTGSMSSLARSIGQTNIPAFTPFAAHCLGFAFATMVLEQEQPEGGETVICIGRDPRKHGTVLADSFARGAGGVKGIKVVYTGIATTPALFEFCRSSLCHGGVMVTASHLPGDRNGLKFFVANHGGFQKSQILRMLELAQQHAHVWFNMGMLPPTSVNNVYCREYVNWMDHYEEKLKNILLKQINCGKKRQDLDEELSSLVTEHHFPLDGLNIVLNSGNGSGGFFRKVLADLGANVEGSINTMPDPEFPRGIPNPENDKMIRETIQACEASNADIGILLDTDADRCGMVAPRTYVKVEEDKGHRFYPANYEPLNRNRLIALIGVIYGRQSPGCAIVTDSTTSYGLTNFLVDDLNLTHIRYLRGYANVIQKAKSVNEEMSANAEVAIETSGHCAARENDFLDDGTFTALKILGLLAQEKQRPEYASKKSLLDLLSNLQELDEVIEFRLPCKDESFETIIWLFDLIALDIETHCEDQMEWAVDRDNLEGIRVSTGKDGSFFLLRKSLHDPVMCLQVEARSKEAAKKMITEPLLSLFQAEPKILQILDMSALEHY